MSEAQLRAAKPLPPEHRVYYLLELPATQYAVDVVPAAAQPPPPPASAPKQRAKGRPSGNLR